MNIKRLFPVICCVVLLVFAVALSGLYRKTPEVTEVERPAVTTVKNESKPAQSEEMRGLWVTYMELNMAGSADKSEKAFREKFEAIAQRAEQLKFNTIIAQVRPFCDALYSSKYFPYSHILSGTQGENPGYDALKIMCEICKSHKLKIHAWINPYRVTLNETPNELADSNPYIKDESLCLETDSGIILDPSNEKARELILNGIEEIVSGYDVDGIQFDDYFYPDNIGDIDSEQYEESKSTLSIEDWRKNNVNKLIAEAYLTVHKADKNVEFGISPQGNLKNNEKLSADVVSWCTVNGYVDYICPQIYFSPTNPKLTFGDSLDEWCGLEFAENVKLYVGLAGYKASSDADEGTWQNSSDILSQEYIACKSNKKVSGIMLYSYASLADKGKSDEMNNLVKSFG